MAKKATDEALKQRIIELEKLVKKNSDEKYRILFERSKDAILIIENGKFVDCNQATVDMLGYKNKKELIHLHPSKISPEYQSDGQVSYAKANKMMDIALEKGSHRFEWDHKRANGEIIPSEIVLTTISDQKKNWVMHTIWRDITKRKQIETAKKEETETLSAILESTPQGIALIDNQNHHIYLNRYFTKITGYTIEDIPTKEDWFQAVYPDGNYRKKASEAWDYDTNHSVKEKIREFKIKCKNGQSKFIEFNTTFLKDRTVSVLTDVTARKKSEELLREKDRLQGVLELSGAVCHELNQPLMSIQGYFDLILMDTPEDAELCSKIDKIQVQIERLSNITRKLMKISRYETKAYLKEKIVDLTKASTEIY